MIDELLTKLSGPDMAELLRHLANNGLRVNCRNIEGWMSQNEYEGRELPSERDDMPIET